jgi:hypothetical protein
MSILSSEANPPDLDEHGPLYFEIAERSVGLMSRSNPAGRAAIGVILVALGVLFLFAQVLGLNIWSVGWPIAIVGLGLFFFVAMLLGGQSAGSLAIPGSIVTTVGLILLFQNTFGRWETWSYAWTLIFIAVGIGIYVKGLWEDRAEDRRTGMRMAGIGVVFFLIFGAFFELGFGTWGFGRAGGTVWALLLVVTGLYLLLRPRGVRHVDAPPEPITKEETNSTPVSGQV